MIRATFTGGPYDGQELALAGKVPGYLLLMDHPTDPSYPAPIVVGADFDDHWPGQVRYEIEDELLAEVAGGLVPTVVYAYASA